MSDSHIRITGVEIHNPPIEIEGCVIVAHLSFEVGPVLVVGSRLVRYDTTGVFRVLFPAFHKRGRVILRGRENHDALLTAALAAYVALCGHSAEMPLATAPDYGVVESESP